jgi:hypothetical protein
LQHVSRFSDSVFLDVKDIPAPFISHEPLPFCEGDTLHFSVVSSPYAVSWFRDSIALPEENNKTEITVHASGTYYAAHTDTAQCQSTSDTVSVVFYPYPSLKIAADKPLPLCTGEVLWLKALSNAGSFHWSGGQNTQSIHVRDGGTYKVKVSSTEGCTVADSIHVSTVAGEFDLLPNLITPNGDGMNETFFVQGLEEGYSFSVYNSWGSKVYSAPSYNNLWNADDLSDGIYFYHLTSDYCKKEWKGWVEVVR